MTVIGLRSHHITWNKYKIPKGQANDYACNMMRRADEDHIEVKTLYRYGKPATMVYTLAEFDAWQKHADKLATGGI